MNRAALDRAVNLLLEVEKDLDTTKTTCQHCGVVRATNWLDTRKAIELRAIIAKLERWSKEG